MNHLFACFRMFGVNIFPAAPFIWNSFTSTLIQVTCHFTFAFKLCTWQLYIIIIQEKLLNNFNTSYIIIFLSTHPAAVETDCSYVWVCPLFRFDRQENTKQRRYNGTLVEHGEPTTEPNSNLFHFDYVWVDHIHLHVVNNRHLPRPSQLFPYEWAFFKLSLWEWIKKGDAQTYLSVWPWEGDAQSVFCRWRRCSQEIEKFLSDKNGNKIRVRLAACLRVRSCQISTDGCCRWNGITLDR